jgi:fused signal recognition particle receptor
MSENTPKSKKSLWEILNTPVQDLFKEETVAPEAVVETVVETLPEVSPIERPSEPGSEPDVQDQAEPVAEASPAESGQGDAEDEESDWFKSLKSMLWLGLGKDKPHLDGVEKKSWLARIRERLSKTRSQFVEGMHRLAKGRTKVDEEMLEELEELLLQSDMGIDTTDRILEHLRQEAKRRRFLPEEVLPSLIEYLQKELESEPFRVEEGRLNIFLIVGVNGTGKTTTVGKIAAKLKISGYKVMMAAGDTFRAAAIDQLGIWGKRAGVPVIHHQEGSDAAAVVYDAIQAAHARKVDVLLIDTAGRLHNKDYLMDELRKVYRVIDREKRDARLESLLVLDATTGQNGLRQAEVFAKAVDLNALILTKLDGTAKGGVIFSIKQAMGLPIKLVGIGEHLEDLQEFEPRDFVEAMFADESFAETEA